MDTQDIQEMVRAVRKDAEEGSSAEELARKFATFAKKYPRLFAACSDVNFPLMEHLDHMLPLAKAVQTGGTKHEDATALVTDRLKKQYIDPLIANLPKDEKSTVK